MCIVKDRSLTFYITIIIIGFFFVLVDTTPGHQIDNHIHIFQNDPDIIAGTILLFFGGFGLGHRLKYQLPLPTNKIFQPKSD